MGNAADVIQGLIMRIDMNAHKVKNKKLANQLLSKLKDKFHKLLLEDDDKIFFDNFEKLITSQHSRPYIVGNFFPENMGEYAKYGNVFGFSGDFRFEIRFMISCVLCSKDIINDFVIKRKKYDSYILLNKYEEALSVLEEIERNYGTSYWAMECKFFLNSKLGKDNTELIESAPANVIGSVLSFFELKNRESITSDEYFYIAEKEINAARTHLDNCNDAIEFLNYYVLGNAYKEEPEKIMYALSAMQRGALIDRYLFVVKICSTLMNQPKTNFFYSCMQTYMAMLESIRDEHLDALRFVLDNEENRKSKYKLKSRLDTAKSSFISGNLVQAREEAIELLTQFPNNTEAMSLLVEVNILIDDGESQFADTNLGMILRRLSSVYTLNSNRDDAMEDVNKIAIACSQSTWAQSLLSDVMCRCYMNHEFEYGHYKILSNLQHLDIETILVSLNRSEVIRFINRKFDCDDPYIQFRLALLDNNYKRANEICKIEQIKDYLFVCDNNLIVEKMRHLHPIEGPNASIAVLTMKQFLASIDIEKNSEIAFKTAANLVVDNIYTALFIPWEKLVTYIDEGPSKLRRNICTPILYYIYAYYIRRDKKDELGIVCGDFFYFENIEYPSIMINSLNKYDKKLLVYFLKNVCTTKIMDDAVCTFQNTNERDQERVEICKVLTRIDPDNAKDYENEIREITQKLMINKELKSIDESRIHVNVDGIRDRLVDGEGANERFDKNLKNDFQRFLFYQDEKMQQLLRVLKGESPEKFKQFNNSSLRLLNELVYKIRDAFVSSDEYGLDGYLSLNIRHGTLDDELRSPLHKSCLYVKKDVNTNTYIVNERWTRYASEDDKIILQDAFGIFYVQTEGILMKLKGEYIQIRTELKNERGLFDYRLSEKNMVTISGLAENAITFEDFFEQVISYFWTLTERNLEEVKSIIRTEIMQDYISAFCTLKNNLLQISDKSILRELQQKIGEAETDMQNALERICYWFQRSNESKHSDFNLQFAFDLGVQTIVNMHPEKQFVVDKLSETVSDNILGSYLKSFDGIFYNIFDNIYKKATPTSTGKIRIGYALENIEGKMKIYIENDYDCSKDISADVMRVEEAKELYKSGEYLERAKGEGGTGIPKICKIINYDLRCEPQIDFGYNMEKNIFFIEIEFNIGGCNANINSRR